MSHTTFLVFLIIIINLTTNLFAKSIILTEHNSSAGLAETKEHFNQILQENSTLNKFYKNEKFNLNIGRKENRYVVSVENLQTDEELTTIYLTLKKFFPQAFVKENSTKSRELLQKEDEIKEMNTLYLETIFSISIISVVLFILFLKRMHTIKSSHKSVIEKQQKLELFLTQTGEKIHSITNEIVDNSSQSLMDSGRIEELNSVKNRLFDETRMMIYFLKLKSKKIELIQENFNINTMLSNILGALSSNFHGVKTELIFDIDRDMPKIITSDLLHLTEIIIELLQNSIQQTEEGQVKLSMTILPKDILFIQVSDTSKTMCQERMENIFIPTYREDGTPKRLGLYIASELTSLLGGTLYAKEATPCGLSVECKMPIINPFPKEFRKYRVPDLSYIKKRVLLCEKNLDAAQAIEKMLNYFQYEVDIYSCDKPLLEQANMISYDLIMGDIVNLTTVDIYTIQKYRKKYGLKVVNLTSVFQEDLKRGHKYIDEWLRKPLSQERLYDLIVLLFDKDGEISMNAKAKNSVDNMKILSAKEQEELEHITIENLKKFRSAKILVADDSAIDQKILKYILLQGDMQITLVDNGVEALENLYSGDTKYDLVFMDISMPVMDGYEAMRHIRENEKFSLLPLVATTSVTLESEIDKIFRYGANGYIEKPLTIPALYATLNFFLNKENRATEEQTKQSTPPKPLRNIVGLDYKRGIRNTKNNEILYGEVLSEFVLAYGDSSRVIQRMLHEDRHQQLKRLFLDLRSLTNAIGAYDLFSVVDTIYKHYIYNTLHLIPHQIESYDKELDKLLKAIEEYQSLKT